MSIKVVTLAGKPSKRSGRTYSSRTGFNHWFNKGKQHAAKSSQLTPQPAGTDPGQAQGTHPTPPPSQNGLGQVRHEERTAERMETPAEQKGE